MSSSTTLNLSYTFESPRQKVRDAVLATEQLIEKTKTEKRAVALEAARVKAEQFAAEEENRLSASLRAEQLDAEEADRKAAALATEQLDAKTKREQRAVALEAARLKAEQFAEEEENRKNEQRKAEAALRSAAEKMATKPMLNITVPRVIRALPKMHDAEFAKRRSILVVIVVAFMLLLSLIPGVLLPPTLSMTEDNGSLSVVDTNSPATLLLLGTNQVATSFFSLTPKPASYDPEQTKMVLKSPEGFGAMLKTIISAPIVAVRRAMSAVLHLLGGHHHNTQTHSSAVH
jgi:hypothetical protein